MLLHSAPRTGARTRSTPALAPWPRIRHSATLATAALVRIRSLELRLFRRRRGLRAVERSHQRLCHRTRLELPGQSTRLRQGTDRSTHHLHNLDTTGKARDREDSTARRIGRGRSSRRSAAPLRLAHGRRHGHQDDRPIALARSHEAFDLRRSLGTSHQRAKAETSGAHLHASVAGTGGHELAVCARKGTRAQKMFPLKRATSTRTQIPEWRLFKSTTRKVAKLQRCHSKRPWQPKQVMLRRIPHLG